MKGKLIIRCRESGKIIQSFEGPNLIVYKAKEVVLNLLNMKQDNQKLFILQMGVDGTKPVKTQTHLLDPDVKKAGSISWKNFDKVSAEGTGSGAKVHCSVIIKGDEFNRNAQGVDYQEAGIFLSDNNTMFARVVFTKMTKVPGREFDIEWIISFESKTT